MLTLALTLALQTTSAAPPRVLTVYEQEGTYAIACAAYLETGDESRIAIDIGDGETSTLDCQDYPESMEIVAANAKERTFRAWYATASKRLGLSADPDDRRHCYDYRAFFSAMRDGKAHEPRRGKRFPREFEWPGTFAGNWTRADGVTTLHGRDESGERWTIIAGPDSQLEQCRRLKR
jgi:hypothetical protein